MKTVNVFFTDKEHEKLLKEKGRTSWHDFILRLVGDKNNENND